MNVASGVTSSCRSSCPLAADSSKSSISRSAVSRLKTRVGRPRFRQLDDNKKVSVAAPTRMTSKDKAQWTRPSGSGTPSCNAVWLIRYRALEVTVTKPQTARVAVVSTIATTGKELATNLAAMSPVTVKDRAVRCHASPVLSFCSPVSKGRPLTDCRRRTQRAGRRTSGVTALCPR